MFQRIQKKGPGPKFNDFFYANNLLIAYELPKLYQYVDQQHYSIRNNTKSLQK